MNAPAAFRKRMNIFIDLAGLIAFVFISITGLIMHFLLPPGSGHFSLLWGLDRHQWGAIHFWIAVAFFAILAIHLLLHWRWIVAVLRGGSESEMRYRMVLGTVGLMALLVLAITPFLSPVEKTGGSPPHTQRKQPRLEENAETTAPVFSLDSSVTIPPPAPAEKSIQKKESEYQDIRGSMTLRDLETATGIPYLEVIRRLGIDEATEPDEQMGRLCRRYGFTMDSIRQVVVDLGSD